MNTIEQAKKLSKTLRMPPRGGIELEAADTIDALIANNDQLTVDLCIVASRMMEAEAELTALKQQEPVRWLYEAATPGGFFQEISDKRKTGNYLDPACWEETPLYLAAGAQAKPLTENQRNAAWHDHWNNPSIPSMACYAFHAGIRCAEAAHGIEAKLKERNQ